MITPNRLEVFPDCVPGCKLEFEVNKTGTAVKARIHVPPCRHIYDERPRWNYASFLQSTAYAVIDTYMGTHVLAIVSDHQTANRLKLDRWKSVSRRDRTVSVIKIPKEVASQMVDLIRTINIYDAKERK